ncbi:50S ribosomal protein L17 [Spathaspora sp. JA1]|nr:50S ribosomal protein L17 [Spathaspora sp. JA1]
MGNPLQKHHVNVARLTSSINKNLCANIIRHEYIVTTLPKAKKAQPLIESFLSKSLNRIRQQKTELQKTDKEAVEVEDVREFKFLHSPDVNEIGSKVINELSLRFPNRRNGFTRLIRLERRLGEDKASMAVLELVGSEYEIKFWYTAKTVARLELQGLQLDDITKLNVEKITSSRIEGDVKFREAVELCKKEFFKVDPETNEVTDEQIKANLNNLPSNLKYYGGSLQDTLLVSKKFNTKKRPNKSEKVEIPQSPFLTQK